MRRASRPVIAGALVIAAVLGFLVYQGISNNVVYYLYPSELLAKGAAGYGHSFRLGGLVAPGSRRWDPADQTLRFVLEDPKGRLPVISHGLPPEMFREGIGVVVEGTYANHLFRATNLMIKHCSTYTAPKPGQLPPPDSCIVSASK